MTLTNSSHNWEEEEVENPVGHMGWLFNLETHELIVLGNIRIADGEDAPWFDLRTDIKFAVLLDGVASIPDCAFCGGRMLKSIQIPKSVTSIGDYAFNYCQKMTEFFISSSVTSIGHNPFVGCEKLRRIKVADGNNHFKVVDGVLFNKEMTHLISYAACTQSNYTIPSSVTSIGNGAFGYCTSLESVMIPDSIASIGVFAFSNCYALTSVTIPKSVTSIGSFAFALCNKLKAVTIPNGLKYPSGAFQGFDSLKITKY